MKEQGDLLTLSEAARLLGMSPTMIRRWAEERRVPSTGVEGELLFRRSDIEALALGIKEA